MSGFASRLAWLLAAIVALASPMAQAIDIKPLVSPGGIRYWLVEDTTVPIISITFSMAGGALLDPVGKEGTASLLSRVLDQGAGPHDASTFKTLQDDAAARLGFWAGAERFGGSLRMLRDQRAQSIELLRLALAEPRLDAEAIERQRRATISGLRRNEESPGSIASRTLYRATFGEHPYGRQVDGTATSVGAVTPEDLKALAARQLTRNRLIVAVVGDTNAQDIGPLLDQAFGALPPGDSVPEAPVWSPPPPRSGGRLLTVQRPMPQSIALMSLPGMKRDDPDWYAATVMNYVLGGGGFNSRLMNEVRDRRGLAYGASSRLSYYAQGGVFTASVATMNERVAESIAIIRAQFDLMARDGVTERELAEAKQYLVGSLALTLDSTAAIAGLLHQMQADNLAPDHLTRRRELIERVSADDVRRVARRLLRDDALTIVVVGQPVGLTATE
ncbi:MAG: insulinase family protein [Alphaproteobacteria bacterium]|nr:insulinase family protein [Alphaproteobacteria bacterium]MCW5742133.1 insulinase family protein [Alphaproteobacteria bacterium]